jgi:sec-independent protein translocase protein TatB
MLLWLGPTDMAAIFVIALLLFGPDQLPKVARQLGEVMRHMQNTTQTFMLEMDRAARETDIRPNAELDEFPRPESNGDDGGEILPEAQAETQPEPQSESTPDTTQSPVVPKPEPPAGEVK